jgi:hypothetical protein
MPAYQRMFGRVNHHFNIENIGQTQEVIGEPLMNPQNSLTSIAAQLGIAMTDGEREQLDKLPRGIQAAIRAVLNDNFGRDEPWEVQFVWEPSYDYRITVHEAGPSSISDGGISIILGTRYPGDELPSVPPPQ